MARRETAPGIFYSDNPCVTFGEQDVDWLVAAARQNDKQRARLCAHPDTADPVHEMLICLLGGCYIRPHAHRTAESAHAIRGVCDVLLFDQSGRVENVLRLDADSIDSPDSKQFLRLPPRTFHAQLIRSPYFVFHETTCGPFDPADTIFPDWWPDDHSPRREACVEELEAAAQRFRRQKADRR